MFDPADYTILIAEDERDLQIMVAQHLVDEGYNTVQVTTGLEAVAQMRREPTDLVLLDIMMPGLANGLSVLKRIRETPQIAQTPVIMMTAMADEAHVTAAIASGATGYIVKPFKLRELTERVEAQLHQRPPRWQAQAAPSDAAPSYIFVDA